MWQALLALHRVDSASGFLGGMELFEIDSKSMRKVGSSDDVVTMVDVQTSHGAVIETNGRMLIQLH